MTDVSFHLNGEPVRLTGVAPTRTLLDWLREERGLTGTKEGCNEGDCGACTVMVTDARGVRALNACILFLPQVQGAAVRTVEGIAAPDGTPHPVQAAMVAHHGSQCGFCTPGFVVSMAVAHLQGATDHADRLAGNLCRCTGYAPILRAASAAAAAPVPAHMRDDAGLFPAPTPPDRPAGPPPDQGPAEDGPPLVAPRPQDAGPVARPATEDALAAWFLRHPEATLVAGATDVGLWVTKGLRDLSPVAFLAGIDSLRRLTVADGMVQAGAMVTIEALRTALAAANPSLAELFRRYGSVQVRNAATIGGNIANGSPIGDSPPALIALGAVLHLRQGDARRSMPLEDFFLDYRKQDRRPGEFVTGVTFPAAVPAFRAYKLSKRFDSDISAVCGAFNVGVEAGVVVSARIAFGGMAGTPRRAPAVEAALVGRPWGLATVRAARGAFAQDFAPLSDMRASAGYRLETAANLLERYLHDLAGVPVSVLAVAP